MSKKIVVFTFGGKMLELYLRLRCMQNRNQMQAQKSLYTVYLKYDNFTT